MQVHAQLKGREVEYVATNGHLLVIRCTDGRELQVEWVNDNGEPIRGKPVLRFAGVNVIARVKEIDHRREVGL